MPVLGLCEAVNWRFSDRRRSMECSQQNRIEILRSAPVHRSCRDNNNGTRKLVLTQCTRRAESFFDRPVRRPCSFRLHRSWQPAGKASHFARQAVSTAEALSEGITHSSRALIHTPRSRLAMARSHSRLTLRDCKRFRESAKKSSRFALPHTGVGTPRRLLRACVA